MNINKETIINSIQLFDKKKDANKNEINQADLYLRHSKKQKEMWQIIIEILIQNQYDDVINFFCAQFFKEKMKFDFYQIQNSDQNFLLSNILDILKQHQKSSSAIRSFLTEVFVIFYMNNFELIGDLILFFQTHFQDEKGQQYIFLIIELIPEKALSSSIVIEEEKRQLFIQHLMINVEQQIFQILENNVNVQNINKQFLLRGFQSWVIFTKNDKFIEHLDQSKIFTLLIQSFDNIEIVEYSCSILQQILKKFKNSNGFQKINLIIAQNIEKMINICIQNIEDGLIEEAYNIIKLICKFGKKNISYILSQQDLKFLYSLQKIFCLQDSDQDLMQPIFQLFSQILEFLTQEQLFDEEYESFFINLLQNSLLKLVYSDFYENSQDYDKVLIYDQRQLIGDLFCEVSDYLNLDKVLDFIIEQIQDDIKNIQSEQNQQNLLIFESMLFIIDFMVRHVTFKENELTINLEQKQQIFQVIKFSIVIDIQNWQLKKTILKLIKNFSSFLNQNPEYITALFQYSVQCVQDKNLFSSACKTISQLCTNNQQFVIDNFQDFMALFENLKHNDDFLIGITDAIQTIQNNQLYQQYLTQILQPFANNLTYQCQNDYNEQQVKWSFEKLVLIIKRVTPAQPDHTEHILQPIFKELFKILCKIKIFKDDEELVEESCRVCKHTIRCLQHLFQPYLLEYMQFITNQFDKKPLGSYLYQAEVIVTVFGQDEKFKNYLLEMLLFLSQRTLEEIKNIQIADESPQLIEDFFGMNTRYIRYAQDISVHQYSQQLLKNLFDLIYMSIGIQNPSAAKTLYFFIENIIQYNQNEKIQQLFMNGYGLRFTEKLIKEIISYPNQEIREHIYDIFDQLIKEFGNESIQWIKDSIQEIGQDILTQNEKSRFLDDIRRNDTREKAFRIFEKRCKQSQLRQNI